MNDRLRPTFLCLGMLAVFTTPAQAQDDVADDPEPAVEASEAAAGVTRQQTDSQVMDEIELDTAEITGNQELPRVLYIVPWQESDAGDLAGPPVGTLLEEVPVALDREEFTRRVAYFEVLHGKHE